MEDSGFDSRWGSVGKSTSQGFHILKILQQYMFVKVSDKHTPGLKIDFKLITITKVSIILYKHVR